MKNILFCADGTWNGTDTDDNHDGQADITNVLKLFHMLSGELSVECLRLQDEADKTLQDASGIRQVAKYLHGVGDSSNKIEQVLGGVFGAGLIARIVRGYTYVSRHYDAGDKIFLVGFSRGAYTARALAGMIASVGLLNRHTLDLEDKDMAYSLGIAAWRQYRQMAAQQSTDVLSTARFSTMVSSLPGFARIPLQPGQLVPNVPIEAVAVWDAVGALGVPLFDWQGRSMDVYRFADEKLSPSVRYGIHAVSLDEMRVNFQPTLWSADPRVNQCLFIGAHADIGGGYPSTESDLSDIALNWMVDELRPLGVLMKPAVANWQANVSGKAHTPWTEGVFATLPRARRQWPAGHGMKVHPTVAQRMSADASYLPALPS